MKSIYQIYIILLITGCSQSPSLSSFADLQKIPLKKLQTYIDQSTITKETIEELIIKEIFDTNHITAVLYVPKQQTYIFHHKTNTIVFKHPNTVWAYTNKYGVLIFNNKVPIISSEKFKSLSNIYQPTIPDIASFDKWIEPFFNEKSEYYLWGFADTPYSALYYNIDSITKSDIFKDYIPYMSFLKQGNSHYIDNMIGESDIQHRYWTINGLLYVLFINNYYDFEGRKQQYIQLKYPWDNSSLETELP